MVPTSDPTPDSGTGADAIFDSLRLFLTDGWRKLDFAPEQVRVGLVQLHAWQVQALPSVPAGFEGSVAYLIKIGFDLRLAAGCPPLQYFDLGFEFGAEKSVVQDALPYATDQREPRRTFRVGPLLQFVLADGQAPDSEDRPSGLVLAASGYDIEVSGIGGNAVHWQMRPTPDGPLRAGSYVHWVLLLTDPAEEQAPVLVTSGFDLPEADRRDLQAGARSAAFTIDLPGRGVAPSPPRAAELIITPRAGASRRVFITYGHDDAEHKAAVARFAALLRARPELDVQLDQWAGRRRRNWHRWAVTNMREADFVIVIASPVYRQVGDFRLHDSDHRGLQAEYSFLADRLDYNRDEWTPKILPVILPGRSIDDIPIAFEPQNSDHYPVTQLDEAGVEDLVETLLWEEPSEPIATS